MEDKFGIADRRNLDRLEMNYPAIYTRFDLEGRPSDEKPSRSVNVTWEG